VGGGESGYRRPRPVMFKYLPGLSGFLSGSGGDADGGNGLPGGVEGQADGVERDGEFGDGAATEV
jgi:hypothetical protein